MIDDVFSQKYFLHENPVGKRINVNGFAGPSEIVGVVGHVKQWGLDVDDVQTPRAQLYLPCMQMSNDFIATTPSGSSVMIRYAAGGSGLFDSIRQLSSRMSSQQVVFGAQSMDEMISDSLASQRFSMIVLGVFAVVAVLLASIGIYGVISYVVGQRTREIGIRMALGAERREILRLIMGTGGRLALAGAALGLVAALGLTRLMVSLLYGVSATDPLTLVSVSTVLILVALMASYIPARRAARVDPMVALRYE